MNGLHALIWRLTLARKKGLEWSRNRKSVGAAADGGWRDAGHLGDMGAGEALAARRGHLRHDRVWRGVMKALLASTPATTGEKRKRIVLKGELPSPLNPPKGCVFSTRCPFVTDRCRSERPQPRELDGRLVACHYSERFLPVAA